MTIAFKQMTYERNEDVYLSYVSLHPEDTYYVNKYTYDAHRSTIVTHPIPPAQHIPC